MNEREHQHVFIKNDDPLCTTIEIEFPSVKEDQISVNIHQNQLNIDSWQLWITVRFNLRFPHWNWNYPLKDKYIVEDITWEIKNGLMIIDLPMRKRKYIEVFPKVTK